MPRAQWIGLGLAAALAVALTAGLVFAILTITRPSAQTATPTALPLAASPTTAAPAPPFLTTPTVAAAAAAPNTLPPPTPAQSVGERLQIANTGGEGANLRRDPGQNGDRIKTVPEGSLVEIVGPDRTIEGTVWRNIRDLQGDVGWVAGGFLALEGTAPIVSAPVPGTTTTSNATVVPVAPATPVARPTSPGVAAASASRGQVGNTNGQGANIRSEPGAGGKVLKTVPEGANLDVLGPEREVDGVIWRQVRDSAGVTGWVVRGAVAPAGSVPTPAPAGTRAPAATPAPGATAAPAAPAPKPTSGSGRSGSGTTPSAPAATAAPTALPGNLPIIIQPATPRAGGGNPTPRPTAQGGATPKPSSNP
jgi:SH3-like domain-containing protein